MKHASVNKNGGSAKAHKAADPTRGRLKDQTSRTIKPKAESGKKTPPRTAAKPTAANATPRRVPMMIVSIIAPCGKTTSEAYNAVKRATKHSELDRMGAAAEKYRKEYTAMHPKATLKLIHKATLAHLATVAKKGGAK